MKTWEMRVSRIISCNDIPKHYTTTLVKQYGIEPFSGSSYLWLVCLSLVSLVRKPFCNTLIV